MLTREEISHVEQTENRLHKQVHLTWANRHQGKKASEEWHEATVAWQARSHPTDFLWSDVFMADLRASHREAMEDAILYLEVDPWYHRSGYLKERLIRGLKRSELTDHDKVRLRNVIWNVAGGRNRREFRNYCSLAAKVSTAEFRQIISEASPERDLAAKGKFAYLQKFLRKHAHDRGS